MIATPAACVAISVA